MVVVVHDSNEVTVSRVVNVRLPDYISLVCFDGVPERLRSNFLALRNVNRSHSQSVSHALSQHPSLSKQARYVDIQQNLLAMFDTHHHPSDAATCQFVLMASGVVLSDMYSVIGKKGLLSFVDIDFSFPILGVGGFVRFSYFVRL